MKNQTSGHLSYPRPLNVLPIRALTCPNTAISEHPIRSELHPLPSVTRMRKIDVQQNKVKIQLESGRQCEVNLLKRLILVLITRKRLPLCALFVYL